MDSKTIEVTVADLKVLHNAWRRVKNVEALYSELLMTGKQADLLRPWSHAETTKLCELRDKLGSALADIAEGDDTELCEPQLVVRNVKRPVM